MSVTYSYITFPTFPSHPLNWLKVHFLLFRHVTVTPDLFSLKIFFLFVQANALCCVSQRVHSHIINCTDRNTANHDVNMWIKELWWWSTSVCSNAALHVRSTLPLNFSPAETNRASEGVEKSWRRSGYSTHVESQDVTHTQN